MFSKGDTQISGGQRPAIAYIGLGSSLGDRKAHLQEALQRLQATGTEIQITASSPLYESPHLGLEPGDSEKYPPHLNLVVAVETFLTPEALLQTVQRVETLGQRQRTQHWGPRTIDMDILVYSSVRVETPELTLPHPGIAERAFVVLPFADIAPDFRLPDGRTLWELCQTENIRSQQIWRYGDELLL